MEVKLVAMQGEEFTIEIGYFDTIFKIKEKIEKYRGIPVSAQTLIFNGNAMIDERNTEFYEILHRSRMKLIVDDKSKICSALLRKKAMLEFTLDDKRVCFDAFLTSSISHLKLRIHVLLRIQANQLGLFFMGNEMMDHQVLGDYAVSDFSEINVQIVKPFSSETNHRG
ncbi:hypothetical protein Sjap_018622 [Stephania japonica]|uniref:Ubiquitin-like domain-containing protein n=1 Tax=Stephania japonica TaxID=461633 RepID=A0AAP0I8F6_9MAGN